MDTGRVPHEHFNINKFKALHAIIHNQTNSKNNFYKAQHAMIKEAQNGEYGAMLDAMEDAIYWLGMKARLYAAKGDFHTEQALRNEAVSIQQSLNDKK